MNDCLMYDNPSVTLATNNQIKSDLSSSTNIQLATKKRKLILHFDQHNTIQVACTLPGRSLTVEEGLNNFLTSAVWGKEDLNTNEWVWVTNEPQINRPKNMPDAITYFKYLEKKIVKSPADRTELKKQTCQFVYSEPGVKFKEFFDLYLESLTYDTASSDDTSNSISNNENENQIEINFESKEAQSVSKKLPCNTIPAGDPENKSLYHLVLPDFFDMIRRLQKEKRDFTIILRTMGIESQSFLDNIRSVFESKCQKHFQDLNSLKINPNIGLIRRLANDRIELEMDGKTYDTDEAIYEKLNSLEGINAIRDDFAYWQKNNYECYSAKPLWINLLDKENHHIIFDDNIRLDAIDDCIVNIRLKSKSINDYGCVDFESYKYFEKSSIIQPNLIQLLNPLLKIDSTKGYYYEKIKKAEKVYEIILENSENLNILTKPDLDSSSSSLSRNDSNQKDSLELESISSVNINSNGSESINNKPQLDNEEMKKLSSLILSFSSSPTFKDLTAIHSNNIKENFSLTNDENEAIKRSDASILSKKRRAKIKLERVMSKEEENIVNKDEEKNTSTICSIQ